MGQRRSLLLQTRCWSTQGMMRRTRVPSKASTISECGRPSRSPFSVHTIHRKKSSKKAATRCLVRPRQVSSLLSRIRLVWRSTCVLSAGTRVLSTCSPYTFTQLASEPKGLLVSGIFPQQTKLHSARTQS